MENSSTKKLFYHWEKKKNIYILHFALVMVFFIVIFWSYFLSVLFLYFEKSIFVFVITLFL